MATEVLEQNRDRRPYAATANLLAVLNRARTRNLPDQINNDFLKIAQIGEAVFGRVMFALEFLDLIEPDGTPTDKLKAMADASEGEFKQLLDSTIREAYADEFARVDPSEDSQAQVRDAFRRYNPKSQIDRMVMLFLGLCREAGIPVRDAPRDRKMHQPAGPRKTAAPPRRSGPSGGVEVRESVDRSRSGVVSPDVLFGFTQDDVANLTEDEFNQVWAALGKVARARAKKVVTPNAVLAEETEEE